MDMVFAAWGGFWEMGEVNVKMMVGRIFFVLRCGLGGGGFVWVGCH